ncbi:MAG: Holliday junction resolvase RuvX [Alphaproteobacteria bacterium]|nr:Holliday junction resolvase RuvX [Alphaproteobacteria bacterium]
MPVDLLKNISAICPKGKYLLGMDVGKKTIGLAICDPDHKIATPIHTIKRKKFTHDVEELLHIIQEYEVGGYVIGLPLNMDGSEGGRAQSVRDFALELAKRTSVVGEDAWIAFWDERLSTVSVEEIVDNLVEKRKTKIKAKSSGLIDKLAAQIILQGAVDFLHE